MRVNYFCIAYLVHAVSLQDLVFAREEDRVSSPSHPLMVRAMATSCAQSSCYSVTAIVSSEIDASHLVLMQSRVPVLFYPPRNAAVRIIRVHSFIPDRKWLIARYGAGQ